jgi:SAM-dependent methyltransferase
MLESATFATQVQEWSRPPVDGVGYISSTDLLALPDHELRRMIDAMRRTRYDVNQWRNWRGKWRDLMGLDRYVGKVLDYGCGVGVESLELAMSGNEVVVADIVQTNIDVTARVLRLYGYAVYNASLIGETQTVALRPGSYDAFHCNGVLHHCVAPRLVMEEAHALLSDHGEARIMVYSDQGWRWATGEDPPDDDVREHPRFETFVRAFDAVGMHADWYDESKIKRLFGDLFEIERFDYITQDGRYCVAVLRKIP